MHLLALTALIAAADSAPVGSLQLSIDDVFVRAARTSEDVDASQAQVFRGIAERRRALSEWMPQANGGVYYDRTIKTIYDDAQLEGTPFGQRNSYALSLSIVENLFSGFSTRSRQRAATANLTSAEVGVAQSRAQAVYDSAQAYYDALLSDELCAIAEATYAQADDTFQKTELSYNSGDKSEFDYLRAKVSRDTQQPQVVQRQVERDLAVLRLKQLLNVPDNQVVVLTSGLDEDLPERVAGVGSDVASIGRDAGHERAPVRQAKALVEAQEAILERVKSQHYPRLDANLQYARQAFPQGLPGWNDFSTNWTIGLALSVNLFSGFRITGDVDYAKADVYEARARLQQTEERARLDTFDAHRQLEAAHAILTAQSGTVAQAQRAYDIADLRYKQGVSTQLELADARLQLQTAKANRARAARDVQVATVRIALLPLLPLSTPSVGVGTAPSRVSTLPSGLNSQQQGSQQSLGSTSSPNISNSTASSLTSPSSSQGSR